MAKKKSDSGFGDRTEEAYNCQRECVQPCFSSGGSSRNCYEELRDIIRKSLVRQNLLPLPSETGGASPDCLSLSTCDSVPAKKKVRMPNVIARLMGLEELPLEDQGTENKGKEDKDSGKCEQEKPMKPRRKHEQKETEMPPKLSRKIPVASVRIDGRNGSNGPKPFCDMDMPMRRFSHHPLEEMVPRRRKLKEIIESMQLTGLLNRSGNHGESFRRPRFASFDQKQNEKMKVSGGKFVGEVPPIVIIKPMVVTKVNREREKTIQERQPILGKKTKAEELRKARNSDRQGVNVKNLVKPEMKQLHDLATRDEREKTATKKPLSVVNHDRNLVPDSRAADAVKAAMPRKPLDKLHPEKEQLRRCHNSQKNHISNGLPGREPRKSCDQKKERKEKAKPEVQLRHVNKMVGSKCKKDETIVNLRVQKLCVSTTASSPHQLGAQEAKDCPRKRNPRGIDESKPDALSEQTSKRNHLGRRYTATKETYQQSGHEILCPEATVAGSINKLKQFLLNSTSFLSAAQEYFDIEVTMFSSPANYKEFVGSNDKLLMDCVFELMKYKSQKHMPRYTNTKLQQKQRARFLSDVLVEELCKELESLFSLQVINNVCAMDDLYLILERDLLCRRLNTSCVWDFGWECGALTEEESDVVFCQLEMLVLGELIEETVADLCAS